MNKLLSSTFTVALLFSSCHGHFGVAHGASLADTEIVKLAGKWQMTLDTPHGAVKGPFTIKQEGVKLTATFESDLVGNLDATGVVDGKKVSFILSVPEGGQHFNFSGTVDGGKMSGTTEMGGNWSATRE